VGLLELYYSLVQLEGRNPCSGFEFINGQRLNAGDKL
jgi:hypothetical protein